MTYFFFSTSEGCCSSVDFCSFCSSWTGYSSVVYLFSSVFWVSSVFCSSLGFASSWGFSLFYATSAVSWACFSVGWVADYVSSGVVYSVVVFSVVILSVVSWVSVVFCVSSEAGFYGSSVVAFSDSWICFCSSGWDSAFYYSVAFWVSDFYVEVVSYWAFYSSWFMVGSSFWAGSVVFSGLRSFTGSDEGGLCSYMVWVCPSPGWAVLVPLIDSGRFGEYAGIEVKPSIIYKEIVL